MAQLRPLRLAYSTEATQHLQEIGAYIRERDPMAARRVAVRLQQVAKRIAAFPDLGRRHAASGTRRFALADLPYMLVYEVDRDEDRVLIIGIYHTAQNRPRA
ncbi:type II toxin-antitoxin system RelE/ParE family toxin [Enterovirga sp. CN4-39]|uniref:type II toxin-antitoxin system RelE/ParE family toxin n=1 Tax=Enterovirga sp. CN4-39 TaxID=3400910 RepID=UPI003C02FD76